MEVFSVEKPGIEGDGQKAGLFFLLAASSSSSWQSVVTVGRVVFTEGASLSMGGKRGRVVVGFLWGFFLGLRLGQAVEGRLGGLFAYPFF